MTATIKTTATRTTVAVTVAGQTFKAAAKLERDAITRVAKQGEEAALMGTITATDYDELLFALDYRNDVQRQAEGLPVCPR